MSIYSTREERLLVHSLSDLVIRHHSDDFDLVGNLFQYAGNFSIALDEPEFGIFEAAFLGEFLDDETCLAEVVARKAGEEVMRHL